MNEEPMISRLDRETQSAAGGYQLRQLDTDTGESALLQTLACDSPFWYPSPFSVSPGGRQAYAVSKTQRSPLLGALFRASTLPELALAEGRLPWTHTFGRGAIGEIQALQALAFARGSVLGYRSTDARLSSGQSSNDRANPRRPADAREAIAGG